MSSQLYRAERSYVKRAYVNRSLAAAIALLCLPLAAQQSDGEQESSWGLGLGVMSSQKAYTDIDRETRAIPFISYENEYIEVLGPNLKYKLPSFELNDSNKLNFNLVGEYDFSDNDRTKPPSLTVWKSVKAVSGPVFGWSGRMTLRPSVWSG